MPLSAGENSNGQKDGVVPTMSCTLSALTRRSVNSTFGVDIGIGVDFFRSVFARFLVNGIPSSAEFREHLPHRTDTPSQRTRWLHDTRPVSRGQTPSRSPSRPRYRYRLRPDFFRFPLSFRERYGGGGGIPSPQPPCSAHALNNSECDPVLSKITVSSSSLYMSNQSPDK